MTKKELSELLIEADAYLTSKYGYRDSMQADYLIAKFICRGGRETNKEEYEAFKSAHPDRDWNGLEDHPHIFLG